MDQFINVGVGGVNLPLKDGYVIQAGGEGVQSSGEARPSCKETGRVMVKVVP